MQFVIREVSTGSFGLRGDGTEHANTVACLSDSAGQGEYWCAQLDVPVQHRLTTPAELSTYPPDLIGEDHTGAYLWVYFLVLRSRDGRLFRPGAYRLWVDVAYVMDLSLSQDTVFDAAKVKWVGAAEITVAPENAAVSDAQTASTPEELTPAAGSGVAASALAPAGIARRTDDAPAAASWPGAAGFSDPPARDRDVTSAWVVPTEDQHRAPELAAEQDAQAPLHGANRQVPGGWAPSAGLHPQPSSRPVSNTFRPGISPSVVDPKQFRQQLEAALSALAGLAGQKKIRADTPCAVEMKPGQPPPQHLPCYSIESGRLLYHTKDPGQGWLWRTTDHPDELLYWIIDDVARSLAWGWAQRSPTFSTIPVRQAQETLAMPYWCVLVQSLNPEWGARTRRGVEALMKAADNRGTH